MNIPIQKELEQIRNRLNELGRAIYDDDEGWNFEAIEEIRPEAMALLQLRRQLWDSQEAKDMGLNGGVDDEIFY